MEKVIFPAEGACSIDGTVVVGAQQNLFLRGGSNQLFQLYEEPDILDDLKLASAWASLTLTRQNMSDENRVLFLQLVIPEKTSVYAPISPLSNVGETRLLKRVRDQIARAIRPQSFLDCYALMTQTLAPLATYRNLDSHLSTFGAHAIVAASLARLDHPSVLQNLRKPSTWQRLPGDLGERFPQIAHENMLVIKHLYNAAGEDLEPELVREYVPPEAKHIGTVKHWRCDNAPIPKKILVFGNSFFGPGSHSGQLSWWFSRMFQNYMFVWTPEVNWDLVEEFQPEFLVAQTIERFLVRVPEF